MWARCKSYLQRSTHLAKSFPDLECDSASASETVNPDVTERQAGWQQFFSLAKTRRFSPHISVRSHGRLSKPLHLFMHASYSHHYASDLCFPNVHPHKPRSVADVKNKRAYVQTSWKHFQMCVCIICKNMQALTSYKPLLPSFLGGQAWLPIQYAVSKKST